MLRVFDELAEDFSFVATVVNRHRRTTNPIEFEMVESDYIADKLEYRVLIFENIQMDLSTTMNMFVFHRLVEKQRLTEKKSPSSVCVCVCVELSQLYIYMKKVDLFAFRMYVACERMKRNMYFIFLPSFSWLTLVYSQINNTKENMFAKMNNKTAVFDKEKLRFILSFFPSSTERREKEILRRNFFFYDYRILNLFHRQLFVQCVFLLSKKNSTIAARECAIRKNINKALKKMREERNASHINAKITSGRFECFCFCFV